MIKGSKSNHLLLRMSRLKANGDAAALSVHLDSHFSDQIDRNGVKHRVLSIVVKSRSFVEAHATLARPLWSISLDPVGIKQKGQQKREPELWLFSFVIRMERST